MTRATLSLFDVAGRSVRVLVDRELGAGTHTVIWDGRDESGRRVGRGVYFARLTVNGTSNAQKIVLLDR
jgi:flagellar hook assembly protein FlgD